MRRIALVIVAAAVAVGVAGVTWRAVRAADSPQLVVGDSVAADFAALADGTFDVFLDSAPGVVGCIGRVHLEAASDLDDAAKYEAATRTVRVRVPATAPSLEESLVHELAHHLEHVCESHLALRPRFLEAQGVPQDAAWYTAPTWEEIPSEQYADAAVAAVLGGRGRNVLRVRIAPEAVDVVALWLRGATEAAG